MNKSITAALLLPLCLASCTRARAPSASGQKNELVIFAAASLTEVMERIASGYQNVSPDTRLLFNFDSSGTLKTQIQEGAAADIFISAGVPQMDELDSRGADLLLSGSRVNLLENRVTLCVPRGNPAGISSFSDWARKMESEDILFAMGNSDVPAGQYAARILTYFALDEDALAHGGKITYASNVKEVTLQIAEAAVDCGIIYCTDAFTSGLTIIAYAEPDMCGQVLYPAAVLAASAHGEEALSFMEYLCSTEAAAVFTQAGFSPLAR